MLENEQKILVDSSVWIDYFKSGKNSALLDNFIDQNIIYVNDLILSELIPYLNIKKQTKVIRLLYNISKIPLNINWENIISLQTLCLKKGINKVGIPDLIILDNVLSNNLYLYTLDKHFKLIHNHKNFLLIDY